MKLKGMVVFITGGGKGIGRAFSLLAASEGAKVVVTDIHEENGQRTVKEIKDEGNEAMFIQLNVSDEEEWRAAVSKTLEHYGTVDVLFNNAGIFVIKPTVDITVEEWNQLMSVNVTGTFLGMKHILPFMKENKKGSVINASSVAGINGAPGRALYGASKGAIRTMTKAVAMEYAPYQIRVNSIHPGFIHTDMALYGAKVQNITVEDIGHKYPLGRVGEPIDVAKTVLFLASDDSLFTTGAEFLVDGGSLASL